MFRVVLLILALLAAIAGLIIGSLNPDPLVIDLLIWRPEASAGLALVASFLMGMLAGLFLALALFGLPAGVRRVRRRSETSGSTAVRVND